jgi:hypothetical protein
VRKKEIKKEKKYIYHRMCLYRIHGQEHTPIQKGGFVFQVGRYTDKTKIHFIPHFCPALLFHHLLHVLLGLYALKNQFYGFNEFIIDNKFYVHMHNYYG